MAVKEWFTPSELAALELPGLPVTRKGILDVAHREGWFDAMDGRGRPLYRPSCYGRGGYQFHYELLLRLADDLVGRADALRYAAVTIASGAAR